jgi:diphosphomevalonate decarboxylase
MGSGDADSFAASLAGPEHWPLADVVAIISRAHKATGSTEGHALAGSSALQTARVAFAEERLHKCKMAVMARDFDAFAEIVELDSTTMHAVMMTSHPPLYYWEPQTLAVMKHIREWRAAGLPVCFTVDAGANVHCLTLQSHTTEVVQKLQGLGIHETLIALPGGPARVVGV